MCGLKTMHTTPSMWRKREFENGTGHENSLKFFLGPSQHSSVTFSRFANVCWAMQVRTPLFTSSHIRNVCDFFLHQKRSNNKHFVRLPLLKILFWNQNSWSHCVGCVVSIVQSSKHLLGLKPYKATLPFLFKLLRMSWNKINKTK